jgi:uncharacterized protein
MSREIEAVEEFYAAINRNDMDAIGKHFDPDIVRIEFAGSPSGGTYRGNTAVCEIVRAGRGSWAEGSCDPEGFYAKDDKVLVFVHAWVRLKDAVNWTGGRFADGFAFRNGMITEYHSFGDREDALKWAGIDDACRGVHAS